MKIAVLSDIHGNRIALDAVLADLETTGVDEYWVLGDLVAMGTDPVGVLQRLTSLQNCFFIRGNTDRYTFAGDRPPPYAADLGTDPEKIRRFAEVAGIFAWAQGAVWAAGWLDWLTRLPLAFQRTLPDGTTCLAIHASPGRDEGPGIGRNHTEDEIVQRLEGCTAGLVCVGHTHQPVNRKVGQWHVLNPGSVGMPMPPVVQASYALITATADGYQAELRQAAYDREQVVAQAQALKHPGADFIIKRMREQV